MTDCKQTAGISEFKDRKGGLVAFGIIQILFGLFSLLMVPLMIIGMFAASSLNSRSTTPVTASMMIPALLLYAALAAWSIWMGIGSLQARRWARALLLVTSWFWLISGTMGLVVMLVFLPDMYGQMGKSGQMPAQLAVVFKYVMMGFMTVFYIVIPGVFVLFYGSRHVKATCERRDPHIRWTDRCPLPALAVSITAGFMAACMPIMGVYGWAVPFFGIILTGATGAAAILASMVLLVYVARGFYKLSTSAWWCAVIMVVAWGVSCGMTFSRISMMEFCAKMHLPAQQLEIMKPFAHSLDFMMVPLCEVWVVALLAYLYYTRKYLLSGENGTTSMSMTHVPEAPQPPLPLPLSQGGEPSGGLAIASFVLGILAVVLGIFVIGGVLGFVGLILGIVHLIRSSSHRAFAGWGVGLSIVGTLMAAGIVLLSVKAYRSRSFHGPELSPEARQQIAALKGAEASLIYDTVISELSAGRQGDAEDILDAFVDKHADDQRLAFAQAVCSRSRWSKDRAGWQFRRVLEMDPATEEGNCARYMLNLDARQHVKDNMQALRLLTDNNPDNPLILWLMAIECRDYYKLTGETTYSREAEQCYRRLLQVFDVGPVLVHQTFANVLSQELKQHDEALVHRRIAVQLEPKSWTYQGLANTLSAMRQYEEANEAYTKLVELDPDNAESWRNWALSLSHQDRYDECIEKNKKALERDPGCFEAYNSWGYALERQGHAEDALDKYNRAMAIHPAHPRAYEAAARVLKTMGKTEDADAMLARKPGATRTKSPRFEATWENPQKAE